MSFSVNTNNGAATALQYLNQTQGALDRTQSAINSGLKVASAKDDGAIYAIAQNQRGAVAGYQSVINSLNNGSSAIDVALSAGQSISDLLIQLKTKALAAADPSIDTASRQALNANFTALRDQISTIVKNAVFNNFNLVDGEKDALRARRSFGRWNRRDGEPLSAGSRRRLLRDTAFHGAWRRGGRDGYALRDGIRGSSECEPHCGDYDENLTSNGRRTRLASARTPKIGISTPPHRTLRPFFWHPIR